MNRKISILCLLTILLPIVLISVVSEIHAETTEDGNVTDKTAIVGHYFTYTWTDRIVFTFPQSQSTKTVTLTTYSGSLPPGLSMSFTSNLVSSVEQLGNNKYTYDITVTVSGTPTTVHPINPSFPYSITYQANLNNKSGGTLTELSILVNPAPTYLLSLSSAGNGSVSGGGTYTEGTSVQINASADNHYHFTQWSDGDTNAQRTIVVNSNISLTAYFSGNVYTITFNANGGTAVEPISATYPAQITLPTSDYPNKQLDGWSDGTQTYPPNTQYTPTSSITLNAVWVDVLYHITYHYPDSTVTISEGVAYNTEVTLAPTKTFDGASIGVGWFTSPNFDVRIGFPGDPYTVTHNVDFYSGALYRLTIRSEGTPDNTGIGPYVYPDTFNLQEKVVVSTTPVSGKIAINPVSGKTLTGWNKIITKDGVTTTTYIGYVFTPDLNGNDPTILEAVWNASPLNSLSIVNEVGVAPNPVTLSLTEATISGVQYNNFTRISIVPDPTGWLGGTIEWICKDSQNNELPYVGSYIQVSPIDSTQRNFEVRILATVAGSFTLYARCENKTSTNGLTLTLIDLYEVDFYKQNPNYDPEEPLYDECYVQECGGVYTWYNNTFPEDPTSENLYFEYWLDADDNLVDYTHPPYYPTICIAQWSDVRSDDGSNHLVIQRFNHDGNAIVMQLDIEIALDFRDTFTPTLSKLATPTQSSATTFITDMAVQESIVVPFIRKCPNNPNDESSDMKLWSNAKWILALRSLVDRWQSDTDGMKILFLPFGLHRIRDGVPMGGELVGKEYDFIGYENKKENPEDPDPLGLKYRLPNGEIVYLVGENVLAGGYDDTLDSKNLTAISGTINVSVGGLTSNMREH